MLRAYLDASATDGAKTGVFAVGGFLGTDTAWVELEAKWREGLETFRLVEQGFHLTDIIPSLGNEMGKLCIFHFSKIVWRSQVEGVGASCDVEYWKTIETGYDNPYHFCLSMVLHIIAQRAQACGNDTKVTVVADSDVEPHRLSEDIFAAHKAKHGTLFDNFPLSNRRVFPLLQCADLAVGALRKQWLVANFGGRSSLDEFLGAMGHKTHFMHFSAEMVQIAKEALERGSTTSEIRH